MSEATLSQKKFSKEQAIKFGWGRTIDNLGFFIVYLLIIFATEFFFSFFIEIFDEAEFYSLSIIFNLGSFIVTIVSSIFAVKIGLRLYDNEKIGSYEFLAFNASTFFKFLLAYILFTIMVIVGFILLIVPGIYLALKYQFFQFLIIDRDMDVIESFKESGRITEGSKWNLFFFALLLILIVIIGVLALIVGIFVAVPVIMVAWAYVYKKLTSGVSSQIADTPPPIPTQSGIVQADSPFQAPS